MPRGWQFSAYCKITSSNLTFIRKLKSLQDLDRITPIVPIYNVKYLLDKEAVCVDVYHCQIQKIYNLCKLFKFRNVGKISAAMNLE